MTISRVDLGGPDVSAQGLGCMGMSQSYGHGDWDESVATIHRAFDLGVTFLDTANVSSPFDLGIFFAFLPAVAAR